GLRFHGGAKSANTLVLFGTPSASQLIQVVVNGKANFYSSANKQVLVLLDTGSNTIQLKNPTIPVVMLGSAGIDKIQIDGGPGANTFVLDTNSVTINGETVWLFDRAPVTLIGKNAADTFRVLNVPNFKVTING